MSLEITPPPKTDGLLIELPYETLSKTLRIVGTLTLHSALILFSPNCWWEKGKWDDQDFVINDSEISLKSMAFFSNPLLLETKNWDLQGNYIPLKWRRSTRDDNGNWIWGRYSRFCTIRAVSWDNKRGITITAKRFLEWKNKDGPGELLYLSKDFNKLENIKSVINKWNSQKLL